MPRHRPEAVFLQQGTREDASRSKAIVNAYTISKLAAGAGVSVHVVRDYVLRGLVHPARRTASGYGIFDGHALARLRFVRTAFEAGIGLDELARLCRALDRGTTDIERYQARLHRLIAARRETLALLDRQLETIVTAGSLRIETESPHA